MARLINAWMARLINALGLVGIYGITEEISHHFSAAKYLIGLCIIFWIFGLQIFI